MAWRGYLDSAPWRVTPQDSHQNNNKYICFLSCIKHKYSQLEDDKISPAGSSLVGWQKVCLWQGKREELQFAMLTKSKSITLLSFFWLRFSPVENCNDITLLCSCQLCYTDHAPLAVDSQLKDHQFLQDLAFNGSSTRLGPNITKQMVCLSYVPQGVLSRVDNCKSAIYPRLLAAWALQKVSPWAPMTPNKITSVCIPRHQSLESKGTDSTNLSWSKRILSYMAAIFSFTLISQRRAVQIMLNQLQKQHGRSEMCYDILH